jgi:hypothetical protein
MTSDLLPIIVYVHLCVRKWHQTTTTLRSVVCARARARVGYIEEKVSEDKFYTPLPAKSERFPAISYTLSGMKQNTICSQT